MLSVFITLISQGRGSDSKTMKKIICVLFALCTLVGTVLSQNRQASTTFTIDTAWPLLGNYSYSYYLDDSGNAVLNGPFSVVGKENISGVVYKYWYQASVNGSYNLTGSAKDGMMNGPIALKSSIKLSATNGESSNCTYILNGNFNNGYPHGAFNLSYKDDWDATVNVNYKNGILVGSYKISAMVDNLLRDITGTLSQEGKMIGVWKYGGSYEETYVNGVLISKVDGAEGKGTPPAMIEKARAYASGQLSKEQLKADNIYVCTDSVDLGMTAWAVILRRDVINWDKLPGYMFSKSAYVKYEYLTQKLFFSDLGFDTIAKELATSICDDRSSNGLSSLTSSQSKLLHGRFVAFDEECNMPFVELHKTSEWMQYVTGAKDINTYYYQVYLTEEQLTKLEQAIFNYQKSNITKLTDIILKKTTRSRKSLLFYYLDKNLDQCQTLYQINSLDSDLKDVYTRFKDDISISSVDNQYCIYTDDYKQSMLTLDSWADLAIQAGGYEELLSQVPETYKETLENKRKEWGLFRHEIYKNQVNEIYKVISTEYGNNYELEQWIRKGYEGTPTPDVLAAAQSKFKTLYNNLKRCEYDSGYMVYSLNGNTISYLNLNDVYELAYYCGMTDLILTNSNESDKALFEKFIKTQQEKGVQQVKNRVDEIFKFLMNKYSSDFTNMYEVEKYVAFDGYESHQYRDAFMSHMLLFTPIVAYEVKDIYGDNLEKVDCIITVEGLFKKTPYQITLTIVNNKVLIKSFDKDNAKKVK